MNLMQWIKQLTGDQLKEIQDKGRIVDGYSKHTYDVQVSGGRVVQVDANSRSSASARARAIGFQVLSVNMVG